MADNKALLKFALIMIAFVLTLFVGYRLGYEQNPCAGLDIILEYPKVNNA